MAAVRVTWNEQSYEWAMSLRGTMSSAAAERETGIPQGTIRRWWGGRAPLCRKRWHNQRTHCRRGHRLAGYNELFNPNGRRQCRACKMEANRRYRLRRTRTWHPVMNPDPLLAPLTQLYLPGPAILEFILDRYTAAEVGAMCPDSGSEAKRWWELRQGKEWFRLDSMDAFFCHLGLVLSEMDVEPLYCPRPQDLPRRDRVAA